jgi:hypothetical protein
MKPRAPMVRKARRPAERGIDSVVKRKKASEALPWEGLEALITAFKALYSP